MCGRPVPPQSGRLRENIPPIPFPLFPLSYHSSLLSRARPPVGEYLEDVVDIHHTIEVEVGKAASSALSPVGKAGKEIIDINCTAAVYISIDDLLSCPFILICSHINDNRQAAASVRSRRMIREARISIQVEWEPLAGESVAIEV
jgi:hypothetical protein